MFLPGVLDDSGQNTTALISNDCNDINLSLMILIFFTQKLLLFSDIFSLTKAICREQY